MDDVKELVEVDKVDVEQIFLNLIDAVRFDIENQETTTPSKVTKYERQILTYVKALEAQIEYYKENWGPYDDEDDEW